MVWIRRLLWDEENEEHVARHGATRDEVEEVAFGAPYITRARHGTYRLIGQTRGGRWLTIYVAPRGSGMFYVVTARDATSNERRAYQRR